jgi:hypothetical protein
MSDRTRTSAETAGYTAEPNSAQNEHRVIEYRRCTSDAHRMARRVTHLVTHLVVAIASGLAMTAGSLAAQSDTAPSLGPVAVGTRVRLWERVASDVSVPVIGRVERIARDSITLAPEAVARPVELAWPSVSRIEVSAGPRTGSRSAGALTGGIIGALGGAVAGVILGNMTNRNAPKFAVAGFVVGGGAGAAIGAYVPGERWQPATTTAVPAH